MRISIIIPTIGRKTLDKVLQALLNSTSFNEINPEIIVIFDGKRDSSFAMFEKDKQIQFFETGQKVYASGARNLGIEKSTGDIIAFLGDDTIPREDWLQKVFNFHSKHTNEKIALLGKISWTAELATDSFHQWLENHAQFDFQNIRRYGATWRHFYTSNISLKRSLISEERFSDKFEGWGFEDIEFGYRLNKKSIQVEFDPMCEVFHDHKQDKQSVWKQIRNSRRNAKVFESLHPEVKIVPRGIKLLILKFLVFMADYFVWISPRILWWKNWKESWIGE